MTKVTRPSPRPTSGTIGRVRAIGHPAVAVVTSLAGVATAVGLRGAFFFAVVGFRTWAGIVSAELAGVTARFTVQDEPAARTDRLSSPQPLRPGRLAWSRSTILSLPPPVPIPGPEGCRPPPARRPALRLHRQISARRTQAQL